MNDSPTSSSERGPIAWMARNHVTANLLMGLLLLGGFLMLLRTKQEVFPEFDMDIITVMIPYPGASPKEVEQGIILAIEEEVRSLDGIKRVTASSNEGAGIVSIELELGTDGNKALQDVKNAVDRITTFPEDAEEPTVSLLTNRNEVISIALYGDQPEEVLWTIAEQLRDDMLQNPRITYVEVYGTRPLEISIEVPHENLRAYNLTLEEIGRQVRNASIELPGGSVKTPGGEVLLRTVERRDWGREFENITVMSRPDGTDVKINDIARVIDGFADVDKEAYYNGKRAVVLSVFRGAKQTPIEVAEEVIRYVDNLKRTLPEGIEISAFGDWSEIFRDRIRLLLKNASIGLVFVLIILGIFLEMRLAFWVTLGIPISILGSFWFIPGVDVSINMISLFAFIVTLGIVVDDAIIVGENIYDARRKGESFIEAAIHGARQMAVPITFAILTNIAAFMPMLFVPGMMGKLFRVIPLVVITVLIISWIESLFILPAHLSHTGTPRETGLCAFIHHRQQRFSNFLLKMINIHYTPLLKFCIRNRYSTTAAGLAILITLLGLVMGGHINFSLMPKVDADIVSVDAVLPYGTNIEVTRKLKDRLLSTAHEVIGEYGGMDITEGIFTQVGSGSRQLSPVAESISQGSHLVSIQISLVPSNQRPISGQEFVRLWRERLGEIPGLESLTFNYSAGPSATKSINIELSHTEIETLENAADDLAEALRTFAGVTDVDDGFAVGKPQLDFKVKPEARSLGITAAELGRQVRNAFYGAEARRQQRGRHEIKVMVRLPERERTSEYNVEELLIRTNGGGEIPLGEAAHVIRGRAYTEIKRADGRRVVNVTADTLPEVTNENKVLAALESDMLPDLMERYPGLGYSYQGQQREMQDALVSLRNGFILALIGIFALLAIPFKSYIQPLIVMMAIPFGIVGAILGHLIMGYGLSIISMMGIVALAGVVVNDALVLIDYANRLRRKGEGALEAIERASVRRFRPILLTSLTTFFGLAPMIFETSMQARFMIPMAISLGYGVLFATFITLLIVPSLYLILEDIKRVLHLTREVSEEASCTNQTATSD